MKRLVLVLMLVSIILVGCDMPVTGVELEQMEAKQAVAVPDVSHYVERENISRRLEIFDNPAQVSWIYCLAENGQVVFYGSVIGKVTSSGKRLEPKMLTGAGEYGGSYIYYEGERTAERMQADGTFGSSDSYVFWFDSDGNYFQWGGNYFLTSIPIKINNAVLNVRDVTEEDTDVSE